MKKIALIAMLVLCKSTIFADANVTYKNCIACHGANGEKVALGKSKIIKDLTKAEFISAMKGYKDGTYGGPLKAMMIAQAKKLSDQEIEELAEKIAK